MKRTLLFFLLLLPLFSNEDYCEFVKNNGDKDQHSHIISLCDSMEKTAIRIHNIYRSSKNITKDKNVLMRDDDIISDNRYSFSTPEDFKKVFTKKGSYKDLLEDIRLKEMRKRYVHALKYSIDESFKRSNSDCISGSVIEGNQIIGLKSGEFLTVESRDRVILRWYKDSDNCEVVKIEDDLFFTYEEFKELKQE